LHDIRGKAVNHGYQLYDVFIYENMTFFDKWNVYDWTLTVYKISGIEVNNVCKFKYSKESRHAK